MLWKVKENTDGNLVDFIVLDTPHLLPKYQENYKPYSFCTCQCVSSTSSNSSSKSTGHSWKKDIEMFQFPPPDVDRKRSKQQYRENIKLVDRLHLDPIRNDHVSEINYNTSIRRSGSLDSLTDFNNWEGYHQYPSRNLKSVRQNSWDHLASNNTDDLPSANNENIIFKQRTALSMPYSTVKDGPKNSKCLGSQGENRPFSYWTSDSKPSAKEANNNVHEKYQETLSNNSKQHNIFGPTTRQANLRFVHGNFTPGTDARDPLNKYGVSTVESTERISDDDLSINSEYLYAEQQRESEKLIARSENDERRSGMESFLQDCAEAQNERAGMMVTKPWRNGARKLKLSSGGMTRKRKISAGTDEFYIVVSTDKKHVSLTQRILGLANQCKCVQQLFRCVSRDPSSLTSSFTSEAGQLNVSENNQTADGQRINDVPFKDCLCVNSILHELCLTGRPDEETASFPVDHLNASLFELPQTQMTQSEKQSPDQDYDSVANIAKPSSSFYKKYENVDYHSEDFLRYHDNGNEFEQSDSFLHFTPVTRKDATDTDIYSSKNDNTSLLRKGFRNEAVVAEPVYRGHTNGDHPSHDKQTSHRVESRQKSTWSYLPEMNNNDAVKKNAYANSGYVDESLGHHHHHNSVLPVCRHSCCDTPYAHKHCLAINEQIHVKARKVEPESSGWQHSLFHCDKHDQSTGYEDMQESVTERHDTPELHCTCKCSCYQVNGCIQCHNERKNSCLLPAVVTDRHWDQTPILRCTCTAPVLMNTCGKQCVPLSSMGFYPSSIHKHLPHQVCIPSHSLAVTENIDYPQYDSETTAYIQSILENLYKKSKSVDYQPVQKSEGYQRHHVHHQQNEAELNLECYSRKKKGKHKSKKGHRSEHKRGHGLSDFSNSQPSQVPMQEEIVDTVQELFNNYGPSQNLNIEMFPPSSSDNLSDRESRLSYGNDCLSTNTRPKSILKHSLQSDQQSDSDSTLHPPPPPPPPLPPPPPRSHKRLNLVGPAPSTNNAESLACSCGRLFHETHANEEATTDRLASHHQSEASQGSSLSPLTSDFESRSEVALRLTDDDMSADDVGLAPLYHTDDMNDSSDSDAPSMVTLLSNPHSIRSDSSHSQRRSVTFEENVSVIDAKDDVPPAPQVPDKIKLTQVLSEEANQARYLDPENSKRFSLLAQIESGVKLKPGPKPFKKFATAKKTNTQKQVSAGNNPEEIRPMNNEDDNAFTYQKSIFSNRSDSQAKANDRNVISKSLQGSDVHNKNITAMKSDNVGETTSILPEQKESNSQAGAKEMKEESETENVSTEHLLRPSDLKDKLKNANENKDNEKSGDRVEAITHLILSKAASSAEVMSHEKLLSLPDWKRQLLERKMQHKYATKKSEEEKWIGVPDWKRKLLEQRQKYSQANTEFEHSSKEENKLVPPWLKEIHQRKQFT